MQKAVVKLSEKTWQFIGEPSMTNLILIDDEHWLLTQLIVNEGKQGEKLISLWSNCGIWFCFLNFNRLTLWLECTIQF